MEVTRVVMLVANVENVVAMALILTESVCFSEMRSAVRVVGSEVGVEDGVAAVELVV